MTSIEAAAMIESRKRKETADKVGKRRPILKLAWPVILCLGDVGKAWNFVTSHELSIIFSRERNASLNNNSSSSFFKTNMLELGARRWPFRFLAEWFSDRPG